MDDNKDEKVNSTKDMAEYFQVMRDNFAEKARQPQSTEEITEEYDSEGRLIKKTTITRYFKVVDTPYFSDVGYTYTSPTPSYGWYPRVGDWIFRW